MDKKWIPNQKQEEFLAIPPDIFEGFYGGAVGGGKSEVLLMLPFVKEYYLHPQFKGIIFRRTFPELEESLIARTKQGIGLNGPSYRDFGGSYNAQQHVWTFPSGATIRFSYLETDDDARSHDTAEYHYVAFDELTAFNEYQYLYLTSRCRSSNPDLPAIIRSASNPGNIGHAWVRDRFVAPYKLGGKVLKDPRTQQYRIFIPAKLSDNPHLGEADPNYLNRLAILPEQERKAKIDGDWFIFSGQVFTEFRPSKIPSEPENALHVIAPFDIPSWWPKAIAIDWGFTHKTAVHWGAIAPDGRVYIYRELISHKQYNSTWASNVRRLSQFDENVKLVVIDPSTKAQRGDIKTIKQQAIEFTGFDIADADNDRIGGKGLLHEYLRWSQKPLQFIPSEGFSYERSQEILRIYGTKAKKEYENMFLPAPPEKNLPRLQIFSTCRDLIRTIPLMIYDDEDKQGVAEDVKKFDGDDSYDSVRYLLKAIDFYQVEVAKQAEERMKLDEIVNAYASGNDTNQFYRRMEYFDANAKGKSKAVSRVRSYFN